MNILQICHATLPQGVVDFFMMVNSVMSWASVEFMNEIAEQLILVERALRRM